MLPGFGGHLISEAFLEASLLTIDGDARHAAGRFRGDLIQWRRRCATLGPASSVRTLLHVGATPLLVALGFDAPIQIESTDQHLAATVGHVNHRTALLVTAWAEPLDPFWRLAITQALRRAADWCVVFNGIRLRIVDASRLYARRFVEFDLDLAQDDERSCAALFRIASAATVIDRNDSGSLHAMVSASDRHAAGVCRSLKEGVLSASADLLGALVARAPLRDGGIGDSFEQALTIVYRMLFLLFAEARSLVPLWHPVYRQSYSVEALRGCAELAEPAPGLWDALRAIARLAHTGCRAGDLHVMPFNGRLFSPSRTPLAERRGLDDEAARRAILSLSTQPTPDRAGRHPIAYRDLGVEQLGAVYETLLDYQPRIAPIPPSPGRRRAHTTVTLERGSGVRKATGTFYTPQPIADYVVRRTLGPMVRDLSSARILQLRIVDPAMGSGAFLVAACRYLAGAFEEALIREGGCHSSDLGEAERAAIRRSIAERCLYGVDLNPMAVQLARLSLWLATLAADRPLTFLDHRLQTGDSLLGAWLANLRQPPDLRRRPAERRPTLPLFDDESVRDALRAALPVRFSLESTPSDTIDQVRAKERAFAGTAARDASMSRWKRIADVWCASWFRQAEIPPAAFGAVSDAILTGRSALPGKTVEHCLAAADAIRASHRFFHWELEFPEVFFDEEGRRLPNRGFDAVIGNPPWDMIRADAGSAEERSDARHEIAALLRFTRDAGIYQAQSTGHANRYQLFVERAVDLTRAGGRIGMVLPAGLATDHGSSALRTRLLTRCNVDAIVGIDNHRGVFPIHRSVRFLLVTASAGLPTREIACRMGLDDVVDLDAIGEQPAETSTWFPVRVTPALLAHLSGPDLAIPSIRTATDLAIAERAASLFPPLGSATGWAAVFGRELNATDDRAAFRPTNDSGRIRLSRAEETAVLAEAAAGHRGAVDGNRARRSDSGRVRRQADSLPVVEGKHVEPFRAALDAVAYTIAVADVQQRLRSDGYQHPRLAYRDVAGASNKLTLIATVLPGGCVSTHTVFCLRTALALQAQHFLCALFNSLVVNYLVRLRVSTHVTTAIVERLPLPTREQAPAAFDDLAAFARILARKADPVAFAQLNARVAELYQLSRAEFEHVLSTFPLVPQQEREAALQQFRVRGRN